MITRRQIICCILSALLLSSCSVGTSAQPQRIVRVKVLADPAMRARNPRWTEEARGLIEGASDYYEREFGIRLITASVSPWPLQERLASTPALLAGLQREFAEPASNETFDLVVSFTAEGLSGYARTGRPRVDRIGSCAQGLGTYIVVPVSKVFRYIGPDAEPELEIIALIHEIGHAFGAEHVRDSASIMHEDFGYRTEFDAGNRRIIEENKFCRFAKSDGKR